MRFNAIPLAAMLILAAQLAAQQLLPPTMAASFATEGTWAEELYLPTQAPSYVRARILFDNTSVPATVSIDWLFKADYAGAGTASQTVDVSFKPTAVARRAGKTSVFYVVGWSERTQRVIVEEWTVGQYSLVAAAPVGGGPSQSVMTNPQIARDVAWISDVGLPPVWDAACQTFSNKLLLLTSGTPTKILSLDIGTRVVSELYVATSTPAIAGHRMLAASLHPIAGFVIMTERRKQWEGITKYTGPEAYFLMRDTDSNGSIDVTESIANNQLYIVYPPPWNNAYTG